MKKEKRLTERVSENGGLLSDCPKTKYTMHGEASKNRIFISKDGDEMKQLYNDEEVEDIARQRDEYKHRAEVAERALIIMAERVLEYAENAKVMATTSDGLFSCEKDAQLALLVNDALLKAEQKLAEEKKEGNNGSDF